MKMLTYPEAAGLLGVKLETLYSLVHRRRVPHTRLGRRLVRFDRDELVGWLDEHRVEVGPVDRVRP